ncbi:hypothetical protein QBC38DRAFT_483045 [Podospora fimiseda]|uniref:Cytochrome c oxidase assembly protein COX20, mitochondrial n=1 Tax=Podospora fimiseda TaxID=252190 RepID=A0AAN7BLG0_9PEZI|nr:hypothetical protein QBC38DRAFT_483045 [Podospora fimiseda]
MSNPKPSNEEQPPWVQTPSSSNTAPSQPPKPSEETNPLLTAASTITPSDFLTFHQTPCARTGLLTGIGIGSGVGILRYILGLPIPRAANWAVGSGVLASIGQYEYCQFRRRQEKEKVKRVVEVYGKVQAEQRAKEAKEAQQKAELEQQRLKEAAESTKTSGWWRLKFW